MVDTNTTQYKYKRWAKKILPKNSSIACTMTGFYMCSSTIIFTIEIISYTYGVNAIGNMGLQKRYDLVPDYQ